MIRISTHVDWVSVSMKSANQVDKLINPKHEMKFKSHPGFKEHVAMRLPYIPLNPFEPPQTKYVTLSYNTRKSLDGEYKANGLVTLSGVETHMFDWLSFVKENNFYDDSNGRITRLDLALDILFGVDEGAEEQKEKTMILLIKALGLDPMTGKVNKARSKLEAGIDPLTGKVNSHKINNVSLVASNGTTVYIGSRSSNFMMRVYDKTAEVNKNLNEPIMNEQVLRFEIELKNELASTVMSALVKEYDSTRQIKSAYLTTIWQQVTNSKMRLRDGKKILNFLKYFDFEESTEVVEFDPVEFERESVAKLTWLREQIAPTMRRLVMEKHNPKTEEEYHVHLADLIRLMGLLHFEPTSEE